MQKSTIHKNYGTLCTSFQKACSNAGLNCNLLDRVGYRDVESQDSDVVAVEFLLFLRDWPQKRTGTSDKKIHILLSGIEKFSLKKKQAIHCTTAVSYLEPGKDLVQPIVDLHYDYEMDVQAGHPVFHAQLGGREIAAGRLSEVGLREKVGKSEKKGYSSIRIPTPYMNVASVFLGLAADHMKDDYFKQFLKSLRGWEAISWDVASSATLMKSIESGNGLRSHHWYFDKA